MLVRLEAAHVARDPTHGDHLTMARRSWTAPRAVGVSAAACLLALFASVGCAPAAAEDDMTVVFRLTPPTPSVGEADLELSLFDVAGEPVEGAELSIEANMNHAGMTPTFATLAPVDGKPGLYTGRVSFTMGGDWFLLLDATLPGGDTLQRKWDVRGVTSR